MPPTKKATRRKTPELLEKLGHFKQGDKRDARVGKAQHLLALHGYYIKSDGVLGGTTAQALSEFQEKAGIPVSGELDPKTWEHLLLRSGL